MTYSLHPATRERLLAITSPDAIGDVLVEQASQRAVVAFLTSYDSPKDSAELEPGILALLKHGCEYFVCFGPESEALHDRIDELLVDHGVANDRVVMTTWHDDETPSEVLAFLFNIAGTKARTLLVAALKPSDAELETLLVQQASNMVG